MTIDNQTRKVKAAGNGVTLIFGFPFKIFKGAETDLDVFKVDKTTLVETPQVLGVDYTVIISTTAEGGSVTYTVAPTSNEDSLIARTVDYTQPLDVPTESEISEEQFENAYDRGVMLNIQNQEQLSRALLSPLSSDITGLIIPNPDPDKFWGWNSAGTQIENKDILTAGVPIPPLINNKEKVLSVDQSETGFEYIQNTMRNAEVNIQTGNYNVLASDKGKILIADTAGLIDFTLPDIVGKEIFIIKNINSGILSLIPGGSDTTETTFLSQDQGIIIYGDGTNNVWRTISASPFAGVTITGGDGIDVTAGEVTVDLATNPGLEFSLAKLIVKVGDGLELDATGIKAKAGTNVTVDAGGINATASAQDFDTGFVALAADTTSTQAHGLGGVPDRMQVQIRGDVSSGVPLSGTNPSIYTHSIVDANGNGLAIEWDATNIYFRWTVWAARSFNTGTSSGASVNVSVEVRAIAWA